MSSTLRALTRPEATATFTFKPLISYSASLTPVSYTHLNALYAKKLAAYILQEKFDAVVCTHLFAMEALTSIKARGLLTVPSYGVLTDYTCIPFFEETHLDEYFIPHADLTAELTAKGMDKEHLILSLIHIWLYRYLPV